MGAGFAQRPEPFSDEELVDEVKAHMISRVQDVGLPGIEKSCKLWWISGELMVVMRVPAGKAGTQLQRRNGIPVKAVVPTKQIHAFYRSGRWKRDVAPWVKWTGP